MIKHTLRHWATALGLACCMGACTIDVDEQAASNYELLQGFWEIESTRAVGTDTYYSAEGKLQNVVPEDGLWHPVTQASTDYMVMHFGRKVSLVACTDHEMKDELNKPKPYVLEGNKMSCLYFYGDFTNFVTIEELTPTRMVLKQVDNGRDTNEDGSYVEQVYTQYVSFHKLKGQEGGEQ